MERERKVRERRDLVTKLDFVPQLNKGRTYFIAA